MKFFKKFKKQKVKKEEEEGAKLGMQGLPVNILEGIRGSGTSARNITRIDTCRIALEKLKRKGMEDSDAYASFIRELDRRLFHFKRDSKKEVG